MYPGAVPEAAGLAGLGDPCAPAAQLLRGPTLGHEEHPGAIDLVQVLEE